MTNILISLFIAVNSIQFFTLSIKTSYLNRTIFNFPKSLMEASLIIDDESHSEPYLDTELFISNCETYFLYTLNSNYFFYTVSYSFYYPENDGLCYEDYCQGALIEFNCNIYQFYTYSKTLSFEVNKQ